MFFFGKNKSKHAQTLILYGSKSGNAKEVAELAHKYYQKNGRKTSCQSIKSYSPEKLKQVQHLLVVISTHGEGDPPPAARDFFKQLFATNTSSMGHLQYSVCALGDSSYQLFCEAGRKIDSRLQELGGKNFYPLTECDVDFSKTAVEWIKGSCQHINGKNEKSQPDDGFSITLDEKSTYQATLLNKKLLSASEAETTCYHLTLRAPGFSFLPGDSIEVKPQNPLRLVEQITRLFPVKEVNTQEKQESEKELANREITKVCEKTLHNYQQEAQNENLADLLHDDQRIADYVSCANVLDMLHDFPSPHISLPVLVSILPPLGYRQYSLASCARNDENFDLMIKSVSYQFQNTLHEGAATYYLCKTLAPGDSFSFRPLSNPYFRLPANANIPVIMIANGSGIAPFRAFLQYCETHTLITPTWLVFGARRQKTDFFYKSEITKYIKNGVLQKLDYAFSRDSEEKFYVQHVLLQKKHELLQWLQKGAHIFVCGSVKMGVHIHDSLNIILQDQKKIPLSGIDDLISTNRYHEDVY